MTILDHQWMVLSCVALSDKVPHANKSSAMARPFNLSEDPYENTKKETWEVVSF